MAQVTNGIQFSDKEMMIYENWRKEDIYEAYILEHEKATRLNIEVNRLNRRLAEIRFMACSNERSE